MCTYNLCFNCIVADDTFAANKRIVKPISHRNLSILERVNNYCVMRVRSGAGNSLGITSSARWQLLRNTFQNKPVHTP